MRIIQQTKGLQKSETVETVRGAIPAHQWLEAEAARIRRDKTRFAEIRPIGIGRAALFVNDVGVSWGGGYKKSRTLKRSLVE